MIDLNGVGVALITPFTENRQEVDYAAFEKLLGHIEPHIDYFVVNGTTAESPTLTTAEKLNILAFVAANNPHKKPIVFGLGGYNTYGIIELYEQMDLQAADAILSVSPQYSRPSQEGIVEHFQTLASAFSHPIVLYNVPSRTGSNMEAETTLTLAQHDNIIGIKEASGDMAQCMTISAGMPKDFCLISGDDPLTLPIISIGGCGVISVVANALPQRFSEAVHLAMQGDFSKAKEVYLPILKINQMLFEEGNPAGVKALCAIQNITNNLVRRPLKEATPALQQQLLEHFQLLKP